MKCGLILGIWAIFFFGYSVLGFGFGFDNSCFKNIPGASDIQANRVELAKCYGPDSDRYCMKFGARSSNSGLNNSSHCKRFCKQVIESGKCNPGKPLSTDCENISECQKVAGKNASDAIDDHKGGIGSAEAGEKLAREGQRAHLNSLEKKIQEMEIAGKNDATAASTFQNDSRVFQQVKRDLKEGKVISEDYADLAKSADVQTDLRALAFYSGGKNSLEKLKTFHQQQIQELEVIVDKAKRGVLAMESIHEAKGGQVAAAKEDNPDTAMAAKRENGLKAGNSPENIVGLTPEQLKELEKKLAKISNKALRDRLRAKLMNQLKSDPSKANELLEKLDGEISEIVELEKKTNDPRKLDKILKEAEQNVMNVGPTDDFRSEIQRLEDERAGILDENTKTLFERVRQYLVECQKNQCVVVPGGAK